MKTVAFFDAKPYDKESFIKQNRNDINFKFFDNRLNRDTVSMAAGCDAVCAFVNDVVDKTVIERLKEYGVGLVALRCAGYNNVDLRATNGVIKVARVPAYSPHAIAEHTMGMILTLNRRLHRAYIRTRDHNFSLEGLIGFDLYGKTVGIIGTGKIGLCFADICKGFGMKILACDPHKRDDFIGEYVDINTLLSKSDIISLHCPLTKENRHFINEKTISLMKKGAFVINTSRGQLIDTAALIEGIKNGCVGAAGLDVYEEETDVFFEDLSEEIIRDDTLSSLISLPNVLVTSHQAFLTREALEEIAKTTIKNLTDFFEGKPLENEVVFSK